MKKLAVVSTHPIQYNAPWFRLLAESGKVHPKVFYTWSQSKEGGKFDPGFGKVIEWDIPLLEGYEYCFVNNVAKEPGTHHFWGVDNPTLLKEVEAWKPDAILVFGWSFKSHLHCLRYFKGRIPVLFRGDSTLLNEQPGLKQMLRRIFLTWVYRHVDYALYVGTRNKEYYLAHGLKASQLVRAPHAVDNARFETEAEELEKQALEWRRQLGILDEQLVILFAGKIQAVKNPLFLAKLAAACEGEKFRFLVVGNGVMEEELKQAVSADKRFIFLDFQNQGRMPLVYRLGDVFVLPSVSETWGLALNEVMACGRPVLVSTKVGGAIDLIPAERNGMAFDPAETAGAAAFIKKLQVNPAFRLNAGKASGEIIRDFSFRSIVSAIEGIFNEQKQ